MITIYDKDCTDFTTNGLGTLDALSCIVAGKLNNNIGEVTLVHPIDEMGKWTRIQEGCILRVPVPAASTPRMRTGGSGAITTVDLYTVQTGGQRLNLRVKPSLTARVISAYKPGTEVIVLDKSDAQWFEVETPDGKHGYMWAENLTPKSGGQSIPAEQAEAAVVEPKTVRDQPFRIYKTVKTFDKVTVYARHIFYDLMDNWVTEYKPGSGMTGAAVIQGLSAACMDAHDFTFYCDLDSTAEEVEFINKNPVEAIMGGDGFIEKYGGEITADWFDVYITERIGQDSGRAIRQGKDLLGIDYGVDDSKVSTRIIPTGKDKDGNTLFLPTSGGGTIYIDTPNEDRFSAYPHPKISQLDVKDAKEQTSGDERRTKEECYQLMRDAVNEAYENGADMPDVTLNVNYVECSETEEYKQFGLLQGIFEGDTVSVWARVAGTVAMRMTQYSFNALTRKYESMTLGTAEPTIESSTISGRQIAAGTISGNKLILNSVGAGQIQNGAINGLKLAMAAIDFAHIREATVNRLNAEAMIAQTARLNALTADTVDADELTAALANVISLTATKIRAGEIAADSITAAMAEINALDVGFAQIKDAAVDQLITRDAVADRYFIDKLQVRNLQVLEQTVGSLIIKAADGAYYRLDVDRDRGTVKPMPVEPGADEIQAGVTADGRRSIIETDLTAADLSAANVKAMNALIDRITAERLDVGTLFAREATIAMLNGYMIRTQTIEALESRLKLTVGGRNYLLASENLNNSRYSETESGVPAIADIAMTDISRLDVF